MNNLTVKKADGTTDVTYTAVIGSAGDNSPARYENRSVGDATAFHPSFGVDSRPNGNGTARRVNTSFVWPKTATNALGATVVMDKGSVTVTSLLPLNFTQAEKEEIIAQAVNLHKTQVVQESMVNGYAPRS